MGSFSISISGATDDAETGAGTEQAFTDDLVALVKKYDDKVTYATASFSETGNVDLKAAAGADSGTTDGGNTGGGTVTAFPVTDAATGFVWKVAGESWTDAQTRLFDYNAGKDASVQVAAPFPTEEEWNAIVV